MNNESDIYKLKEKRYNKVKEGYPVSIAISAKAVCPWLTICKGYVQNIYAEGVCINYEPKSIDFNKESLKCANFKKEGEKNGTNKSRSTKR
jgi:hypothetical protein